MPIRSHARPSARYISRRDRDVGSLSLLPELRDEGRWVRKIRVHGQHELAGGACDAGHERGPVSRFTRLDDLGAVTFGGRSRSRVGRACEQKDFVPDSQAVENTGQLGKEARGVFRVLCDWNEDRSDPTLCCGTRCWSGSCRCGPRDPEPPARPWPVASGAHYTMTGAANMTSIEQPSTATRSRLLAVLLGGLIGAAIACLVLDPQFIRGNGGTWVHPRNDLVAYLVAWNYYIVDRWRLPLFSIPAMSYPEGGNVLFNDALPVTAFMTKVAYHATGARVNPYGWWVFLTYVLQGATAARLAFAVGTRWYWAAGAAAVFAIVNIAFVARLGHTAVSSHFLILWVLALYFDSLRHRRVLGLECGAVLALTLLVNAYLFVMIAGFVAVTVITLWWREQLTRRDFARVGAAVGVTFAIGMLAGYGVLLINPTTMKAQGFGHYSWNVISLLLPPEGFFGFLANVPRDATHGQYEGESFIGAGALLVLVLCLVSRPRQVAASLARHWVYVAALAGFAAYAASNLVYVGNVLVVSVPATNVLDRPR